MEGMGFVKSLREAMGYGRKRQGHIRADPYDRARRDLSS